MNVEMNTMTVDRVPAGRVQVWDRFVRFFHWGVALSFFVAYFTEDNLLTVHVWAGYTIGTLVVMRIIWGFIGPRHARFSDFVCTPWKAWRYVLDLAAFRARRHIGHSPAGGVMVLLLLAGLLATVWSGMELHAIENNSGPLASMSSSVELAARGSFFPLTAMVPPAYADGNEDHERKQEVGGSGEDFWESVHEVLANLLMTLVVLHVLGVVLASVVHRENLVRSMFTGSKQSEN